ncbi:MAG: SMP-30/gluconolactonase/LRE family protein, partial [Omnitrophica WOR_2 bacterium]
CVAWGTGGFIYAGGEAGQLYRISPDGKSQLLANTGGFILGVCVDGDQNVYACDVAKNQVVKVNPAGELSVYSEGSPERKMVSPNYALFDRYGNLYLTASGIAGQNNACLFRIRPGGKTEMVSDEVSQNANGLALSPDGTQLYVILTDLCSVVKIPLGDSNPAGKLKRAEPVVQLDHAVPDGLAMDQEGNLYIGCYAPDVIYRYSSDGQLDVFAQDWKRSTLASPTNLAFGGPDWKTMFVANFARWDLAAAQVEIPGCPPNYPKLG